MNKKVVRDVTGNTASSPVSIGLALTVISAEACGNRLVIVSDLDSALDSASRRKMAMDLGRSLVKDDNLFICTSDKATVRMRVIDNDGAEGDMCGNGLRCIARYLIDNLGYASPVTIETGAGIKTVTKVADGIFSAEIGTPKLDKDLWGFPIFVDGSSFKAFFVNTGEPHLVIVVDDISKVDVESVGKRLSLDKRFKHHTGSEDGSAAVKARTYERGCKRETLSCGTGAVAAAVVAITESKVDGDTADVLFKGGKLTVTYAEGQVTLQGEAKLSDPVTMHVMNPSAAVEIRQ